MAATLRIGRHEIGDHTPCDVIAEVGHNHEGSVGKARGHVLGPLDIVMRSPSGGILPYDLDNVGGRMMLKPLYQDDFLSFEVLGEPNPELARS